MASGPETLARHIVAIGQSTIASSFGAAGALIVLLLWIFYSTLIFLVGAEFTHAFAVIYGSRSLAKRSDRPAPGE